VIDPADAPASTVASNVNVELARPGRLGTVHVIVFVPAS